MRDFQRKEAGIEGEQAALDFLKRKGLRLLLRNHRCKGGELDLVMLDGQTLVLIEVRMRSDQSYGGAAASITPAKQRRLIIAAKHLLITHPELTSYRARFDVVALDGNTFGVTCIDWIKDAFRT